MVFVIDKHKKPLMPTTPKRARLLLEHKRAVVHRLQPFTIRLKDRTIQESAMQPVVLKIDPGSHTTGLALARVESTPDGEIHHAVHLAELIHRGEEIRERLRKRAGYRRRRRSANLRYRAPRFLNRRRQPGWLPPSIRSRIGNVLSWARRYHRWMPISRIDVERVKFDTQLLHHPEISGLHYQRGELFGWEIRTYLLEKFEHTCAYCGRINVAFELDHIWPRSRGGSDSVSNLALSCHDCTIAKGDQTATEYGHPEVEAQAKRPLRDAAVMNATRYALCEALHTLGLPITTWSGGRTRWNRYRFGISKAHALDALCVGQLAGVRAGRLKTFQIRACGRGQYCRTNVDDSGFPRGYLMRQKQVKGIKTGDRVRAVVPEGFVAHGTHTGRIAVRATGQFRMGKIQNIPARFCRVLQLADGYDYALVETALHI